MVLEMTSEVKVSVSVPLLAVVVWVVPVFVIEKHAVLIEGQELIVREWVETGIGLEADDVVVVAEGVHYA